MRDWPDPRLDGPGPGRLAIGCAAVLTALGVLGTLWPLARYVIGLFG